MLGSAGVHFGRAVLQGESQEEQARLCCHPSDATSTLELDLLGPCLLQALPSSLYFAYCMTRTLLLAGRGEAYPLGSLEGKGYFCLNIKH